MSFKDVLVALTTYPERTPNSSIEDAVQVAVALSARVSAIACEVRVPAPASPLGTALLNIPAMVAAELRKSAANAKDVLAGFQDAAERQNVLQDTILEKCSTANEPDVLVDYARLRDLTVVPMTNTDGNERWYAETLIFDSGRPVIALPPEPSPKPTQSFDNVIVAWDFSRQSSRAVADALPILKQSKRVFILTVTNEKIIDTKRSGVELAKHLSRHGVEVILDVVDAAGRDIGTVLRSHIQLRNGDLLVMGAYGHSRFREFVLGGATRSMLLRPPVPTFLSH
ncbi:universal stress protein UspA [Afipia sp. Root123D2]|uniref:universal stress protein n=1 Tax=Afipia sp. Root123D2 TaxID=1736436 RepID=UPI0006FF1EDB|nr:universal stress protein [Afipia sp. Root123D2]KQW21441.1 universal stress protein UspA [Afipia sp. Root123D2]